MLKLIGTTPNRLPGWGIKAIGVDSNSLFCPRYKLTKTISGATSFAADLEHRVSAYLIDITRLCRLFLSVLASTAGIQENDYFNPKKA